MLAQLLKVYQFLSHSEHIEYAEHVYHARNSLELGGSEHRRQILLCVAERGEAREHFDITGGNVQDGRPASVAGGLSDPPFKELPSVTPNGCTQLL
jgi:hypothetical protein